MKRLNIILFLTLSISIVSQKLFAHDFSLENSQGTRIYYYYSENYLSNHEVWVTLNDYDDDDEAPDYNDYSGFVTIPSSVSAPDGYKYSVTRIDYGAFKDCTGLEGVTIPSSVKYIGGYVFENCSSLSNLTIPSSVIDIEDDAFRNCTSLTSMTVRRATPPSIGKDAFKNCNLDNATLYVPEGSKAAYEAHSVWGKFGKIDEIISFSYSNVKALCVANWDTNGDGELSVSEAEAVTSLGNVFKDNNDNWTFNELRYFTGLTTIDGFYNCIGLSAVTIPSSVTAIGDYAFYGCKRLTSVIIPEGVTTIGEYAFYDCSIYVSSTTDVTIPSSVNFIDFSAFGAFGVSNYVTNIKISDLEAWNNISFNRFWGGNYNLYVNGEKVDELVIPNTFTKIGDYAFQKCTSLTSVYIPNSVTSIGKGAFNYCTSLTSVDIPNSVTSIGEEAFQKCTSLTSVDIPNSVITIGNSAFAYCENLVSVTIPNSVETIGSSTFYGLSNLLTINIGNSVSSIGYLALSIFSFYNIIMTVGMETPISVNELDLPNKRKTSTLYVPAGSKAAYEAADYWKEFGTIIEMSNEIIIGSAGMGTFCSIHPLDFSGTDDIKAYIVSAFKPSTGAVTLTRITDVPANTGIVVKGNANTYTIPWGAGETVVANMLVGVTEDTQLNKVDGDNTNYILAKKDGNLGFYAVSNGSTLSAGKAYLPLPTAQLPSGAGARQMTMIFDDETTGIQQTISNTEPNSDYYDLQGRRVSTPTRGLYIINGKKVVIK